MNRRDLLKGFIAATATVAIGLRLSKGMPPIDLKDAIDTFRWELATDNYYYGIDTAKPWHVEFYKKLCGDDWELMEAQDLLAICEDSIQVTEIEVAVRDPEAGLGYGSVNSYPKWTKPAIAHETVEEYGLDPEFEEEMEAASVIAMSQGMAAFKYQGLPASDAVAQYEEGLSTMDDIDVIWVPRIHTKKEALFRHG